MAKARSSKGLLLPPAAAPTHSEDKRANWLAEQGAAFVAKGQANRIIYSRILEELWPVGHGLPGPHISQVRIRQVIDDARAEEGKKAYVDPFRRVRELQGDEGFTSIIKEGVRYQLQSQAVRPKRELRAKPSKKLWDMILNVSDYRCAHCGAQAPDVKLSPDHKVPRSRGGLNDDENWQPLCEQCNNLKSSACQGCALLCTVCSWAYPSDFKPIRVDDNNKEMLRRLAERQGDDQSELANRILRDYFNRS
jgi:5-methylcytosine-specific restriction endonuclease McrA